MNALSLQRNVGTRLDFATPVTNSADAIVCKSAPNIDTLRLSVPVNSGLEAAFLAGAIQLDWHEHVCASHVASGIRSLKEFWIRR
jgi:hypothetical protein